MITLMTYPQFVSEYPSRITDAYTAHHGQPPAHSDINHHLWQIENEGKSLAQVLQELGVEPPPPPPMTLPRLSIDGEFFRTPTGPWTMIQCSDFNLLNRFAAGEDITPILTQRQATGFNTLRVWTALLRNPTIGDIRPTEALYAAIPAFLSLCASYGLYVELTAFTGPYPGMFNSEAAMIMHWEALKEACRVSTVATVFLERVNEGDHGPNVGLPYDRLTRPTAGHIIASAGSNTADHHPVTPLWTYGQYHSNDLYQWQRKTGHNAMELAHAARPRVPFTANENTRMPDKDGSVIHAYDAAKAAALLCAGSCFHSVRGKLSGLWSGNELTCADAWVRGAKSVNLAFQKGRYRHRTDLETSTIIRAYDRVLPDGRVFSVLIHI